MTDGENGYAGHLRAFVESVDRGEPVALVTVVKSEAEGPASGAKLVVWGDGRVMGSFGPGLDGPVLEDAREALRLGVSRSFIYPKPALRTRQTEETAPFEVFVEVVQPPMLVVVGGGHVGGCVARLGKTVGFQVAIVDDRPEWANRERFPEADLIVCEDYETALKGFPINESAYIVVVTRGHKHDEMSVRQVAGSSAAYIGMIGSKRRSGAVLKLLRDSGVPRETLERIHTPIGLDIGAETPEEIAVSIIAEILMVRHGGTGAPMSQVEKPSFFDD